MPEKVIVLVMSHSMVGGKNQFGHIGVRTGKIIFYGWK